MYRRRIPFIVLGLLIASTASALVGCSSGADSTSLATPTYTQEQQHGKQLFSQYCISCHSRIPDEIIVGPSLAGIRDRAAERIEGMGAREYMRSSIMEPSAYVVEGYDPLMPLTLAQELKEEEVDALLAYLMTLDE